VIGFGYKYTEITPRTNYNLPHHPLTLSTHQGKMVKVKKIPQQSAKQSNVKTERVIKKEPKDEKPTKKKHVSFKDDDVQKQKLANKKAALANGKTKLKTKLAKSLKKSSKVKSSASEGVKRPHRFRPGTCALREIRKYQKTAEPLLRKLPFRRLVREICQNTRTIDTPTGGKEDFRWKLDALTSIQEAAESELIKLFEFTNMLAIHSKRQTIMIRDMKLAAVRTPGLTDHTANQTSFMTQ